MKIRLWSINVESITIPNKVNKPQLRAAGGKLCGIAHEEFISRAEGSFKYIG